MSHSPQKPWQKGKHPAYTAFCLTVNICQDEFGNVWSDHDFSDPQDQEIAAGLAQGGVPQVAHALLTEAVRREVFTSALVLLSQDPTFLPRWAAADSLNRKELEVQLERAVGHILSRTIAKMLPGSVSGVLAMLQQQKKQEGAGWDPKA